MGRKLQCKDDALDETVAAVCRRLKELRLRAGLSQAQVARVMGRTSPSGRAYVCQIERGTIQDPEFVVILDYLRACGAKLADLRDIFDRYTSRKPFWEEQAEQAVLDAIKDLPPRLRTRALYYDIGMRHGHGARVKSAEDVTRRVRMAMKQATALAMHKRLNRRFNDIFNDMKLSWGNSLAVNLKTYGRKVFALLMRFRGRKSKWLQKQLAAMDDWPIKYKRQPEPFLRMKQEMIRLFEELRQQGKLD
jgi:transcriptional regulator with XRE-family HTH domain